MDVEGSYWGHSENVLNTRLQSPGPSAREIWKKSKRFSKEKCYFTSFQVEVRSRCVRAALLTSWRKKCITAPYDLKSETVCVYLLYFLARNYLNKLYFFFIFGIYYIFYYSTSNKFIQWASFICTTWLSNIFPYLIQKSPYFFRIGWLGASALFHRFSTIKAVDRKKYPNEKHVIV